MFERFTPEAREVVVRARQAATELQHSSVGTEHLLLAMVESPGPAGDVLRDSGLVAVDVRGEVRRLVSEAPPVLGPADAEALQSVGIDVDAVMARIEATFGPEALVAPASGRRGWRGRRRRGGPFGPQAKKVLELSLREAVRLKDRQITSAHILLGLLREENGLGVQILAGAGLDLGALRERVEQARPHAA